MSDGGSDMTHRMPPRRRGIPLAVRLPPPRYLLVVMALAYAAIGTTLIVQPSRYDNTPSYEWLLALVSQQIWGSVYLVVAAGLALNLWRPLPHIRTIAVLTHTAAIALTAAWLAAFVIRWATDSGTTIVNVASWSVYLALLARSAGMIDRLGPRGSVKEVL